MHATDGYQAKNISATTAAFGLVGGLYSITVIAGSWSSGSVTLQALAGDGSTWIAQVGGATFTANAMDNFETCPPGQYRFAVTDASGVYATIISIPSQ